MKLLTKTLLLLFSLNSFAFSQVNLEEQSFYGCWYDETQPINYASTLSFFQGGEGQETYTTESSDSNGTSLIKTHIVPMTWTLTEGNKITISKLIIEHDIKSVKTYIIDVVTSNSYIYSDYEGIFQDIEETWIDTIHLTNTARMVRCPQPPNLM